MSDPWRYACPDGHRDITRRGQGMTTSNGRTRYYCRTCSQTYDGEPVDLKQEEA